MSNDYLQFKRIQNDAVFSYDFTFNLVRNKAIELKIISNSQHEKEFSSTLKHGQYNGFVINTLFKEIFFNYKCHGDDGDATEIIIGEIVINNLPYDIIDYCTKQSQFSEEIKDTEELTEFYKTTQQETLNTYREFIKYMLNLRHTLNSFYVTFRKSVKDINESRKIFDSYSHNKDKLNKMLSELFMAYISDTCYNEKGDESYYINFIVTLKKRMDGIYYFFTDHNIKYYELYLLFEPLKRVELFDRIREFLKDSEPYFPTYIDDSDCEISDKHVRVFKIVRSVMTK